MDMTVLWNLSYGMYAIGTLDGERPTGCIVNTAVQVTAENPVISICMNKNNYTFDCIKATKRFSVSILSEQTSQNVIAQLGFCSGRDRDKFSDNVFKWAMEDGLPVVTDNTSGYIIADVIKMVEMETHYVILARVTDTKALSEYTPMTYKYYHEVIKGKAPKNAPTYQAPEYTEGKEQWVCSVCGYIYDGDITKEPDDFKCPICKHPKSVFRKKQ